MTRVLGWTAAAVLLAALALGFAYAPKDAVQGNVQRIMYLHVPSILTAYLAFALVLGASVAYLLTQRLRWDQLAASSAELGVIFTGLTLVSGSIWGKPTWGTWWTWDARLTSTAILFLTYIGYLLLRAMSEERERGAKYSAVLGILGAVNIPIVHFSVVWWRTLHQPPTLLSPERAPLSTSMAVTLAVNLAAFTLLFVYLLAKRLALWRLEDEAEA